MIRGGNMNVTKQHDRQLLDQKIPLMPWYIEKFINYKLPDLSPSSLLEYIRDYEMFMNWLISEGIANCSSMKDIPLTTLEGLHMDSIDAYRSFLATKTTGRNGKVTQSRKER